MDPWDLGIAAGLGLVVFFVIVGVAGYILMM